MRDNFTGALLILSTVASGGGVANGILVGMASAARYIDLSSAINNGHGVYMVNAKDKYGSTSNVVFEWKDEPYIVTYNGETVYVN